MKKHGFSLPLPKVLVNFTNTQKSPTSVSEIHYHLGRTEGAQFQSRKLMRSSLAGLQHGHGMGASLRSSPSMMIRIRIYVGGRGELEIGLMLEFELWLVSKIEFDPVSTE